MKKAASDIYFSSDAAYTCDEYVNLLANFVLF